MVLDSLKVSSEQFWMSGIFMGIVDLVFILLLLWRIKSSRFRELRWTLVATAAVFWSLFGVVLVWVFWESYYQYFYPGWFRLGGILIFVPVLYGLFAFAFHWLAMRLPGNPLITFCLLAGIESVLEHLGGIVGLKILEVSLLQEASPASILFFSFPEYVFYWCVVIAIAALLYGRQKRAKLSHPIEPA